MIQDNIIVKIKQVVNVFETASIVGRYASCVITHDGPNGAAQITYGRSQTTEHGNLAALIKKYIDNNGHYADQFKPYLSQIGVISLADDKTFIALLKQAGNDPIMHTTQDFLFDHYYFDPCKTFFDSEGFTLALSLLVLYDSYIQSGGIMTKLRQRFSELTPQHGGDEKKWIESYVNVRHDFIANNPNPEVRDSVYRTNCFLQQIAGNNWDLSQPVNAHFLTVN